MTFRDSKLTTRDFRIRLTVFALCAMAAFFPFFPLGAAAPQATAQGSQAQQEVIGRVSGDDVLVTGEVSFERQNGRTTALLASGSKINLRSGQAMVDLPGVGDLILCGPADLSIVKSGPAITVALNYGEVHLEINATAQFTIYTPLLIITPQPIGERDRDITIGLEQSGDLCITTVSGAIRIQEQFSAESMIVPQGGDVQIERGELRSMHSGSRRCSCELLVSQANTQTQMQLNAAAKTSPNVPPVQHAAAPADQPIYHIDVPLTFNAPPAAPAGPSPEALLIIRQSMTDPANSFRGVVRAAMPAPPPEMSRATSVSRNSKLHFFARLFRLFRRQKAPPEAQSATAHT